MESLFKIQINKLGQVNPDWFDWLSIFVNVCAIFATYLISRSVFNKEIRVRNIENNNIQEFEIQLFKINLDKLYDSIGKQIENLNEYLKNFSIDKTQNLIYNQFVKVDFLDFIDLKHLYKSAGLKDQEKINQINNLLSLLYTIKDFRVSLINEIMTYESKLQICHDKFIAYRVILYTKYLLVVKSEVIDGQGRDIGFTNEYRDLCFSIYERPDIINHKKSIIDEFILPLINITAKDNRLIKNKDVIEINAIANDVKAAYDTILDVDKLHKEKIRDLIGNLESVNKEIKNYLDKSK